MNFALACPQILLLLCAILGAVCCLLLLGQRQIRPFPPGPRGLPFLGVARQHPKSEYWKTYAAWGRKFGTYRNSGRDSTPV